MSELKMIFVKTKCVQYCKTCYEEIDISNENFTHKCPDETIEECKNRKMSSYNLLNKNMKKDFIFKIFQNYYEPTTKHDELIAKLNDPIKESGSTRVSPDIIPQKTITNYPYKNYNEMIVILTNFMNKVGSSNVSFDIILPNRHQKYVFNGKKYRGVSSRYEGADVKYKCRILMEFTKTD